MLKELIYKLKSKNKQQQITNVFNETTKENTTFEINISRENNIFKIVISDYISIVDYVKKMKSSDEFGLLDLISNGVLWNNNKQKINKGTYYVILINNRLYNILINDETLKIDERTKKEFDVVTKKNDITEEKIITFNAISNDYSFCSLKHSKTGSTFYTKYYDKNKIFGLEELDLSTEETLEEINSIISNLESIKGIDNIINIKLLKEYILGDLNRGLVQRKKIL